MRIHYVELGIEEENYEEKVEKRGARSAERWKTQLAGLGCAANL
jgi:hypothetical protein